MENNNNPITEQSVVETPAIVEAPVVETPVADAPVAVEETPAVPVVEDAPKPADDAVKAPAYNSNTDKVPALGAVSNGVMGTTSVSKPEPRITEKVKSEDSSEKVALHSTKNVAWQGVGKISRGYNIVDKSIADQWLTRSHVRLATPEEVKKAFG